MSYSPPPANHIRTFSATTQSIVSTTTPQIILYDATSDFNGITCVNGSAFQLSRFVLPQQGDYFLTFFASTDNAINAVHNIYIWVRKNGVDVGNSCLTASIGSQAPSTSTRGIIFDGITGDYVELWMAGDNTNMRLTALAASASNPVRPATPSIVVDIYMIGSGS